MLRYTFFLTVILVTFLLVDFVSKIDSDRYSKEINKLILDILKKEKKENLNIDTLKEDIFISCKEKGFDLKDLICDIKDNKLNIKYSYKNLNRLSTTEIVLSI